MDTNKSISIVIPVYNAATTIGPLVDRLVGLLRNRLQIVLVNDGSRDNSHEACCSLIDKYPGIIVYLQLAKNFGEHNAVMAGLNHADGDYVVIMDDDFQNPPEEVTRLVGLAENKGYDVVYSYYKKKQHHALRNMGSRFNNWVAVFMLDKPKDLYLSSFKCISRFAVKEVTKYKGPFPYIDGLLLRATRNIGKIETQHKTREQGHSGYTFHKLMSLWLNMFINFSINPLRLSSLLGFLFSGIGILLSIYIVVEKFTHPEIPVGWPFLVVAVTVFSGVQLLILGLLGEYLGRLFMTNNQTPQFVIREIHKKNP